MKATHFLKYFSVLLVLFGGNLQAQDEEDPDQELIKKPKFLTGFFVGSYFANRYTASAYNGYGFAPAGSQNDFVHSLMYQKIKNEYGPGYGLHDQIADALGVEQGQWEFNESDM